MNKWLVTGLLVLLALGGWAPAALARGRAEDKVVIGENFTLAAGQVLTGSLVVLGGNAEIAAGAEVTGQVVVFGGNVTLAGRVGQDLVIFGGNADLLNTGVVAGRLVTSGGSISRAEGSQVQGGETQSPAPPSAWTPRAADSPAGPLDQLLVFVWNGLRTLAVAGVTALLAMVVVLLLPEPTARVSGAIAAAPGLTGGLGLLTLIAVPVLALLLTALTLLCLSPISLLALLVYGVALVFGWLALGTLLGERLAAALRRPGLSPVLAAGLGTFLLSLLAGGLSLLPVIGGVLSGLTNSILLAIGLGAVTLTRFGARPYLAGVPARPIGSSET